VRRLWQATLIGLARSQRTKQLLQTHRGASEIASRYVAGPDARSVIRLAERLRHNHLLISAFYLGEYVDRPELVGENVRQKMLIADALGSNGFDVHISVDPTQIGFRQSPDLAFENAHRIAREIARASNNRPGTHCLMLDMEDDSLVDPTFHLHDQLKSKRLPVAVTVQAYLRRTVDDLYRLMNQGAHVRLVKGAFALRGGQAFKTHSEIKHNYRELVKRMLSREARDAGFYPSIATHDSGIHALALECAERNGWQPDQFEFELLLGVRPDVAANLADRGARVRLYTPFGTDWWPHAARRLGESPSNAWLLFRSMLQNRAKQAA
jgi:proline dehydrogenase